MEKILEIQKTILDDFENEPFYERDIFKTITFDNAITGLVGSRGIGKTTFLLHQVLKEGARTGKALYVSADNLYFLENRLFDLVNQLYKETDIRLLCIDEIQKYPNWQQELKNIADTFRHLRILFSGSSMIELISGKYDLSRRVTLHYLHGLSFREFLDFYHEIKLPVISLEDILKNHLTLSQEITLAKPIKLLKEYFKVGYYPFFKNFTSEYEKFQAIENATQKTIYEDISILHSLKTPTLLIIEKIYKYVLNSLPGELSVNKLSNILGKDFESVSEYFRYLEEAGLIRSIYSAQSGKAHLRNPTKIYPENSNLIYASYLPTTEDATKGKVRETFVLNQLQNINKKVFYSETGDFKVDEMVFEVGGKNKSTAQIKNLKNAYVFADDITVGLGNRIPLYLLGFLY